MVASSSSVAEVAAAAAMAAAPAAGGGGGGGTAAAAAEQVLAGVATGASTAGTMRISSRSACSTPREPPSISAHFVGFIISEFSFLF